jgi:hypothetical protein
MPDISTLGGGPSSVASTPASTTGITLTAHASNNTKASTWTELIASTTYDADWLLVNLVNPSSTGSYLVDIGVGTSTAEVVLVPDLFIDHGAAVTAPIAFTYLLPLRVPRATRLSARCQCLVGGSTLVVGLHAISSPIDAPPGFGRCEAVGLTAASSRGTILNDPGAAAHTDGTWTQLIAATSFPYRWMCLGLANNTDNNYAAAAQGLLDVGIGTGGAEVELISDILIRGDTASDAPIPGTLCFPVAIASGQRVVARHRASVTTAGDRRLDVIAYGVG